MKVKFRNQFFGPDGNRYRPGVEHEVPDSWRKQLPSSAVVIEAEKESAPAGKPVEAVASAPAAATAKGAKL